MAGYIAFFFMGTAGCIFLNVLYSKKNKTELPGIQLIFLGAILILMSSLRNESVGVDTSLYRNIFLVLGRTHLFDDVPANFARFPGYRLLCRVVYILTGGSYRVMITVISVIIVYGFLKFFYKKSDNYLMSAVYFATLYFFLNSFNSHRQHTAMAIMLLAFLAYDEKKFLKGTFLAALAVSFHNVSIIMCIYLILSKVKWTKPVFILYSALVAAGRYVGDLVISVFISIFPRYSFYSTYTWHYSQTRKFSTSMIYLLLVIFAMIFFSESMFKAVGNSLVRSSDRTLAEPLWTFMSITMIDIMLRFVYPIDSGSVYPRIQSFFSFFVVLFIPGVIERVDSKWRPWLYLASNAIFIYATVVRIRANYGGVYPYRFFWQ